MYSSTQSRRGSGRGVTRKKRGLVEHLESRLLMSVSVFEYAPPASGFVSSSHMVSDASGFIYSMASGGGILKLDPVSGAQTFIDIPSQTGSGLLNFADLTFGADGNLWIAESYYNSDFTQLSGDVIKVTTGGTVLATYSLGTSHGIVTSPNFGPDGKLYIGTSEVGAPAADGNATYNNSIVAMNSNGTFTSFAVTKTDGYITDLKVSANGDVFVSLTGNSFEPAVGDPYETPSALAVLHAGTVTDIAINGAANPNGMLFSLTIAPDGSVWFPLVYNGNSFSGGENQIVRATFDSALTPTYTSYSIPGVASDDVLFAGGITAATDGNIYVTESAGSNLDIVNTVTNTVSRVAIGSGNTVWTTPQQIGASIYFATQAGNNFARVDLPVSGSGTSIAGLAGASITDAVAILDTTLSAADIAGLSATITWGDSSTSAGTIVDNGDGTISVVGTHTYAVDGDYATKVVVTGATIDPVSVLGDATILPSVTFAAAGVPVPSHIEESTFSALVASFIGPADSYTATINWGNGVTTSGTVMLISGVYQVVGSVNYAAQGNYNISVTITGTLNSAVVGTSVTIGDVPLVLTAVQPVVLAGKISNGAIAFFSDDTDSRKQNYDATITWGDGDSSKGNIQSLGNGQYVIMANHNYKKKTTGMFTITTTLNTVAGEDAGANASVSVVIHV